MISRITGTSQVDCRYREVDCRQVLYTGTSKMYRGKWPQNVMHVTHMVTAGTLEKNKDMGLPPQPEKLNIVHGAKPNKRLKVHLVRR